MLAALLPHPTITEMMGSDERPVVGDTHGNNWRVFGATDNCFAGLRVGPDGTLLGYRLTMIGDGSPLWGAAIGIGCRRPPTLDELVAIALTFSDPAHPPTVADVVSGMLYSFFDYDMLPGPEVMDAVHGIRIGEETVGRRVLGDQVWQRFVWNAMDGPHPRSNEFRLSLTWAIRIMAHTRLLVPA